MTEGQSSRDPQNSDSPAPAERPSAFRSPDDGQSEHENGSQIPQPKPAVAWQPFTPRGLAAFAKTTFGPVLLLLATTALITAGTVVWFLNTAWFPTIRAAMHELPDQGEIVNQKLNTPRVTAEPLAEHRWLGFVVLVGKPASGDLNSHIVVKFRKTTCEICSLFGCLRFDYPRGYSIEFNRVELEPRWGAWEPFILGAAAVGTFLLSVGFWIVMGFLYAFVPWVLAWSKKRDLSFMGSWWMCAAASVPGSSIFTAAIWAYGLGILDVLQFFLLAVAQVAICWVYIGFAFRLLPGRPPPRGKNPFLLRGVGPA
jgi:hypothetical protein